MSTQDITMKRTEVKRNPYLAKWNILFDKRVAEWISFQPQLGLQVYTCYACRDMFGSKSSFLDHVNRRGILLNYKCSACDEQSNLTFYNPCAFLLHTRQHFNLARGQIDLDKLEISMLPYGLAGFLPDPNIPLIYDVEDDGLDQNTFINSRFYSPVQNNMGQKIVNLISNELLFFYSPSLKGPTVSLALKQISSNIPRCQFVTLDSNRFMVVPNGVDINGQEVQSQKFQNSNQACGTAHVKEEPQDIPEQSNNNYGVPVITKIETINSSDNEKQPLNNQRSNRDDTALNIYPRCPECHELQKVSMSEHFLSENKPIDETLKCSICKYVAPSKCSLYAHERIHENLSPFVCPECGKDFENWNFLHDHLDDVCFHLAKQVRLRCPGKKCGKIFAQNVTYCAHFSIHMQCLNKCCICNAAFFNELDFLLHAQSHENNQIPQKIYQCTVCNDNSSTYTKENYLEHIKWHAENRSQCMYVYICKHCRSYFRSTLTYATHLLRCSKLLSNANPHLTPPQSTLIEEGQHPTIKMHQLLTVCMNCKSSLKFQIRDLKNLPTHCTKCGEKFTAPFKSSPLKKTDTVKTNITTSLTGFNCKVIPTKEEASRIKCLLCTKSLSREEMKTHFNLKQCKFLNPIVLLDQNLPQSPKTVKIKEEKVESPQSDDSAKRKRKKYNSCSNIKNKKSLASLPEIEMDLQAEEPMIFDGVYRCKLCEYVNENRTNFHEHIIHHREISTSYQCMECGECFVVKPSLAKHLVYYHKIIDTERYFEENNCFDKDAVKKLEEVMKLAPGESREPVAENQCRVCMKQFSDPHDLNKHFRIHGMAFLFKNCL